MTDFAAHVANMINRIGQPVTITPSGGPVRSVNAVFTTTPGEAFGLIGGNRLQLRVCAADSADLARGDAVAIGAKNYTIAGVDDDSGDSGDRIIKLEAV